MRKHWLMLTHNDFCKPINLSQATDMLACEAEADDFATKAIQGGDYWAYVYELKRVYLQRPKGPAKEAEIVYVD